MAQVSMIVWNTFQNDARVLKEAETLAGQGHALTVFALLQPGETPEHEVLAPGLAVVRVSRTPLRALRRLFQPDGSRPPRAVTAGVGGAFVDTPLKSSRLRRAGEVLSRSAIHLGLYRALVASRPDVVHAHDVNTLPTAWAAARRAKARLVYDAHEISTDREGYRELRGVIAWAEKRLMPRADATITTTEMRAKFFARAYGVPRPLVMQNRPRFADLERGTLIRDRLGLGDELPIVLYQGGLQPGRGLEDLVAAMPAMPPCHLVFIGGGRLLGALKTMVGDRGLESRVHFIPTLPLAELLAWTASADIGAQPIRNTCLNHLSTDSNKLFEYAMAGLPVVASGFPEIRRVVEAHGFGLLFDPETAGALAAVLGRLVADAPLRARLAANARASARALSWEAQEAELIGLYERVLARSSARRPRPPQA
jgi:glycosyltransferase involved in cell wall biosynthesis